MARPRRGLGLTYDDSAEQFTRSIDTGAGVILIADTISLLAGAAGATTVETVLRLRLKLAPSAHFRVLV